MLKSDAVPTINLPVNRTQNVISTSAINRAKKMEAKSIKEVNFYIFQFNINSILYFNKIQINEQFLKVTTLLLTFTLYINMLGLLIEKF